LPEPLTPTTKKRRARLGCSTHHKTIRASCPG
jgi:hypothetical protein